MSERRRASAIAIICFMGLGCSGESTGLPDQLSLAANVKVGPSHPNSVRMVFCGQAECKTKYSKRILSVRVKGMGRVEHFSILSKAVAK